MYQIMVDRFCHGEGTDALMHAKDGQNIILHEDWNEMPFLNIAENGDNFANDFFGGDAVSAKIVDFATKVPSNITGVYYYEARDAVATAITNVIAGSDIDTELQTAEDTVNFNMGQ